MDITKFSNESLRNVCTYLLDQDILTEKQFLAIVSAQPSNELKRCVDVIHTMLCLDLHDLGHCEYYTEEQCAECWTMAAHRTWLENTTRMLQDHSVSEAQLADTFKQANRVLGDFMKLNLLEQWAFRKLLAMSIDLTEED